MLRPVAHAHPATDKPAENSPHARLRHRFKLPQYDVEVGPFHHLHDEREHLALMEWRHFSVTPLGATIGGVVSGVDLTEDLADDVIGEIRSALLAYKVIFFRDQPLTPEAHIALAKRFGDLEIHPFLPPNAQHPELVRFEKGQEVGGYENGWHSDVTWRESPSMGAILHAIEVPASGGDTLFADMSAAYGALDDETKEQIDNLIAVHDYSLAFGTGLSPDEQAAMRETYPPVEHPVVRTHPETGKQLLYVNRYFTRTIVGFEDHEARILIEKLCRQADIIEFQCRFQWRADSVAFWDNRAVQHYASSDYWPSRRVVERASIIGDRPY